MCGAPAHLEILEPFRPYPVGSVLNGTVTEWSDIYLHLFAESCMQVEVFPESNGIPFEQEVVTIRNGGVFLEYPHIYLEESGMLIECTVYPEADIRRFPISSITGMPMERAAEKDHNGDGPGSQRKSKSGNCLDGVIEEVDMLQSVQSVPNKVTSSLYRLPGDNDQRDTAVNCSGGDEQA